MPKIKFPGVARADLPILIDALNVLIDDVAQPPKLIGWTPERAALREQLQEDLAERTA